MAWLLRFFPAGGWRAVAAEAQTCSWEMLIVIHKIGGGSQLPALGQAGWAESIPGGLIWLFRFFLAGGWRAVAAEAQTCSWEMRIAIHKIGGGKPAAGPGASRVGRGYSGPMAWHSRFFPDGWLARRGSGSTNLCPGAAHSHLYNGWKAGSMKQWPAQALLRRSVGRPDGIQNPSWPGFAFLHVVGWGRRPDPSVVQKAGLGEMRKGNEKKGKKSFSMIPGGKGKGNAYMEGYRSTPSPSQARGRKPTQW